MKYVAMATGGVEFGDDDTAPILKNTYDQDDGDADERSNETTGFEPGASSTPAPNGNQRQTTMNRPGEQPSFDVEFPDVIGTSTTDIAMDIVVKEFPFVDKFKVFATIENERVKVALIKKGKGGKTLQKSYYLTTKIRGTGEYKINSEIKGELKNALGEGRRETLEEKIKSLTAGIVADKKVEEDPRKSQTERNHARERAKRKIYDRTAAVREMDQLKKGNYSIPSESIELQTLQKKNDEIQREKEEQDEIINDENSSPAEKNMPRKEKMNSSKNKMKSIMKKKEK